MDINLEQKKFNLTAEFVTAFVAAQEMLENVKKDRTTGQGKFAYDYSSLPSVLSAVKHALNKNKLAFCQCLLNHPGGGGIGVKTLIFGEGGWISSVITVEDIPVPDKGSPAQAMGSMTTYLRRYAIQSMVGIAGISDDDDGAIMTSPGSEQISSEKAAAITDAFKRMGDAGNLKGFLASVNPKVRYDRVADIKDRDWRRARNLTNRKLSSLSTEDNQLEPIPEDL